MHDNDEFALKRAAESFNMSESVIGPSVFTTCNKKSILMSSRCAKPIVKHKDNERGHKPVRAGNGKRVSMWSMCGHVKACVHMCEHV